MRFPCHRRITKTVEDRYLDIDPYRAVPIGNNRVPNRRVAHYSHGANAREEQVTLRGLELLRRLLLKFQRKDFRTLAHRVGNQAIDISGRWSDSRRILDQLKTVQVWIAQHSGESREGGVLVVLSVQQKQFGLR